MNTALRRGAVALAVSLAVTPTLAACGEEGSAAGHTTHTTAVSTTADPLAGLPPEAAGVLAEVEARGKPTLEATGPVAEMKVTDDVVGTGAEVAAGATVAVHYVGAAATTGEEFDSSWETGAPAQFSLDQVIKGWGEGLVGMKVGGRRTLVIPAELAYGDEGPAPGDSLIFTVDLVAVL